MRSLRLVMVLVAGIVAAVGCSDAGNGGGTGLPPDEPRIGANEFVSADGSSGDPTKRGDDDLAGGGGAGAPTDGESDGGGERTVEEGDIYRVLAGSRILNLNAYRGLQVIDFSTPSQPSIIGRVDVAGSPVELYVSGTRAYVLLNNWRGYYGNRTDVQVDMVEGGLVLAVDLSNPRNPVVTGQAVVPGWIRTSRLARSGSAEALYVVTQDYGYVETDGASSWTTTTWVKSFSLAGGAVTEQTTLDLGGWVQDIAATPGALLVARNDWNRNDSRSTVSIIDISRTDGTMIEGDEILVEGMVNNQFNMDLRGNVLRVVSGSGWGGGTTNHLETFDATDIGNLTRIDHDTFGDNEQLYGTLFLDNKAFFVTYLRTDPFHAFEITDAGVATEKSEFIVSGWNDFFRSTFDGDRLIGIGTEDTGGRTMAVSLYDVTNLTNPNPLIDREEVEATYSYSEASWDHRAFSVLEDAVSVRAADGTLETGLVLLPFSGWDSQSSRYFAAVQIFTFSETTLTRRGVMNHGTQVRRSFLADASTTANLSEAELSLFDNANPDGPVELGRVELAPNYTDVLVYGSYGVRQKTNDWYWNYYGNGQTPPPSKVEIFSMGQHPDTATTVASVEVPASAFLRKVGNLLVAVDMKIVDYSNWPYSYETKLTVFDLSNPTNPRRRGELVTTDLKPDYGGYNGYYYGGPEVGDCFDCGYGWYYGYGWEGTGLPVGEALAFVDRTPEQQHLGTEHVCYTYPEDAYRGCDDWTEGCEFYSGSIVCRTLDGDTSCTGAIQACTYDPEDGYECRAVEESTVATDTQCYDNEAYRYWQRFTVRAVDLSNPDSPRVTNAITSARDEEAAGVVTDGSDLWLSYKTPYTVPGDSRPYVRYWARRIGFANPAFPAVGRPVNVPGQLLQVDGNDVYTRDFVWGSNIVETAIARLRLSGGSAWLEARRRFRDQQVDTLLLDGAGHVLVSHRQSWLAPSTSSSREGQQLSILDADTVDFDVLSSTEVDSWAQLRDAKLGRALFQVPGGLLVFNVDDARTPYAQAYFSTKGWPSRFLLTGRDVIFPAGRYGIYKFDIDSTNLLVAP